MLFITTNKIDRKDKIKLDVKSYFISNQVRIGHVERYETNNALTNINISCPLNKKIQSRANSQ